MMRVSRSEALDVFFFPYFPYFPPPGPTQRINSHASWTTDRISYAHFPLPLLLLRLS